MALIVTTFDHTLKIPPHFKGLVGKDWFEKELKANEPTDLPDKIAEYYTKNWGKKYRYAYDEEKSIYTPEEIKKGEQEPPKEFDAMTFLADNYQNIEVAVNEITDRKQLFKIAEALKFSDFVKQKNDRIKERIINDVKVKTSQDNATSQNEE